MLAWCILAALAEAVDGERPSEIGIELFDRLRLREPLAQSFAALGIEGEDSWRTAARIRATTRHSCN